MGINTKKWALLLSSAGLYSAAFIFNNSLWWLSFIFLIPLYYAVLKEWITSYDGFAWGIVAIGLHLYGIFRAITFQAEGSPFLCSLPVVGILFYVGIMSFLFFLIAHICTRILGNFHTKFLTLIIWACITAFYFIILQNFSFLPAGVQQGYCLLNPLLPLIHFPALLSLLPIIGNYSVLFLLCASQASITYALFNPKAPIKLLAVILAIIPWLLALGYAPKITPAPEWLNNIIVMPWRFKVPETDVGKALEQQLTKYMPRNPTKKLVLLPEGAIHPSDLQKIGPDCFEWKNQPLDIIVGGTTWREQKRFNTLYWLKNGCIHDVYHKRHAMVLIEYLAPYLNCNFLHNLYFSKIIPMSVSTNPHTQWELLPGIKFVPYICSELFFSKKPDDSFPDTILALCGDHWAFDAYIKELMSMSARFKAIEWQRAIVYVSFFFAHYCTKEGGTFFVDRLKNNFS